MTANLLALTREKRELQMKRFLMPATALSMKNVAFTILCCAVLVFIAAPPLAQADPCTTPTIGNPVQLTGFANTAPNCGVVITITGTTGNLTATITGDLIPYDLSDDVLVGIQNNSSVTVGAIRLSTPSIALAPFGFDGDGPCNYAFDNNDGSTADCYNAGAPVFSTEADPLDYEGPDNTFVGISPDFTTGTVIFSTPIPGTSSPETPGGSTWFALEETPTNVVSIGETQTLATGTTNVFPFGPFTCPSESCGGKAPVPWVWTETSSGDDFQFTPVSALTSTPSNPDYWTFLPIPVCAGPVGEAPFGPFTTFGFNPGYFGTELPSGCPTYGPPAFVTNFPQPNTNYPNANSLACVPYLDYSSPNSPMCIELERDCSGPDCVPPYLQNLQWTGRLDYDIDVSIAAPIGGPAVLFAPGLPGPTSPNSPAPYTTMATDFTVNAITAYTGAQPGADPPPAKTGGTDGKSVFVAAFSPAESVTNPIPVGVTVGFPGFEFPTANASTNTGNNPPPTCPPQTVTAEYLFPGGGQENIKAPENCLIKVLGVRLPWLLAWDDTTTSNTPITTLQLCPTVMSGACTTPHVSAPWVHLSLVPVNSSCGSFTGQNPLSGTFTNVGQLFPKVQSAQGQYTFLWQPVNNPVGCEVSVVLQFDTGTIASPAVFLYSY